MSDKASTSIERTSAGFPRDAWDLLSPSLTDERRRKMEFVAAHRTDRVRLVVQDIHDPHNVAACMRSAEAFGVLNVDVVHVTHKFRASTVARGSGTWLKTRTWTSVADCAAALKAKGVRLAAGYPDANALPLHDLPVDAPIALVFGNEHAGLHDDWAEFVDYKFTIPMVGMVESLNISVSAALSMHALTRKALEHLGPDGYYLPDDDRRDLLSDWICRQITTHELQLKRLRANP